MSNAAATMRPRTPKVSGPAPPLEFFVESTTPKGSLTTLNSSGEATCSHLHRSLQHYQDAINGRRFWHSDPGWRYLANNFTFRSIDGLQLSGPDNHLTYMAKWCAAFPNVSLVLHNMSTDLDEAVGKATTLCDLEVRGMPLGTVRHCTQTITWKKVGGEWAGMGCVIIEGPGLD